MTATRLLRAALVCGIGAVMVAVFFRYQIAGGFSLLNGDTGDQVLAIAILEHWYNVFRGMEWWRQPIYFYPVSDTIGYDDGYFLFGAIYAPFRVAGIDPYLSAELVSVVLRGVGFASFYLAMRRIFATDVGWALLGASVFTLGNSLFIEAVHLQLFGVSLVPVMALLLDATIRAMHEARPWRMLAWGVASAAFYAAWLMSSFYMAWYFLFFSVFALVFYLLAVGRAGASLLAAEMWRQRIPTAIVLLAALVCAIPFLTAYLPKARETGMHAYRGGVTPFIPSVFDVFDVGNGNVLYGRAVEYINHVIRPGFPAFSERTTGFEPVLLALFGMAVFWIWRHRRSHGPLLVALALAAVATWAMTLQIRSVSLWWFIYSFFPGGKAPRVVARYQIFLVAPVVAIVTLYLARQWHAGAKGLAGVVAALLLLGELNTAAPRAIDRHRELAWLRSVPPPPPQCRSFFVSRNLGGDPSMEPAYRSNAAAMIVAETRHLPTLNGMATFTPSGWDLLNSQSEQYPSAVHRFAEQHGLTGLCSLDLQHSQWSIAQDFGR